MPLCITPVSVKPNGNVCVPFTGSLLQALNCVQLLALLMRKYLRGMVEASLLQYERFWQQYAIPQGSRAAYAGEWDLRDPSIA